jgi:hypothetical protein
METRSSKRTHVSSKLGTLLLSSLWIVGCVGPDSPSETGVPPNGRFISSAPYSIIGTWGEEGNKREIRAFQYGTGRTKRAIIGGLHGWSEANTVDLMQGMMAYLDAHPELIPKDITLYIVPKANPDGYRRGESGQCTAQETNCGRTNARLVDLNRNWDYNWSVEASTVSGASISGGTKPFSEPETIALRDFIEGRLCQPEAIEGRLCQPETTPMNAAIFYHSAWRKVFEGAGGSEKVPKSWTRDLAQKMAKATSYVYDNVGVQGIQGDAIDYLTSKASVNSGRFPDAISAVEIELPVHDRLNLVDGDGQLLEATDAVSTQVWSENLNALTNFLTWQPPWCQRYGIFDNVKCVSGIQGVDEGRDKCEEGGRCGTINCGSCECYLADGTHHPIYAGSYCYPPRDDNR